MIIGIDYGLSWCGLAQSDGEIASPFESVETKNLIPLLMSHKPTLVVVGISESHMAEKTSRFVKKLQKMLICPVTTVDETLSSIEAQKIEPKDKKRQHAVAAAVILERYLEQERENV